MCNLIRGYTNETTALQQQLLQQQQQQQQEQQALSLPANAKIRQSSKNSQSSISSLDMGSQSHSSNSAKFKLHFFNLGTLTRSKKNLKV
ncbi:hypothetical protein EVAR_69478_1 [Eumeta japonica]|uniref:Uncharacterized protein n=1 Tax=Eumeta variegata TaxID=151549 RepID=A0A4C1SSV3_EUMVA|nr:hypothetical protein EVAR_69478_1 [Eumeta japonica]